MPKSRADPQARSCGAASSTSTCPGRRGRPQASPSTSPARWPPYVDSSTKPSNGTKYGESSEAWGFQWDNSTVSWSGGVVYLRHAGPNKTFYEGVIRALESALPDVNNGSGDRVEVYGDCQTVINQLNGVWQVGQLRKHYERVRVVERKIKK